MIVDILSSVEIDLCIRCPSIDPVSWAINSKGVMTCPDVHFRLPGPILCFSCHRFNTSHAKLIARQQTLRTQAGTVLKHTTEQMSRPRKS
jgi:hypothetical protein